jgi:multidrug transporter EmrE-like cation transporter
MSVVVFSIVMAAALLHASWNAIVKSAGDKFLTTIMVTAAAGAVAAVLLPFLPAPARSSWPYAAASAIFQITYFLLVARTYQVSDMSQAYPLMRGTAPLLVALVSEFRPGDVLSRTAWAGVIAICVGIFSIALGNRTGQRKGLYLALLNALVIAGYTLIDGAGVRRSGAPSISV